MISITATKLRSHLFDFLNKVLSGETVSIKLNGKEVALLIPTKPENWRKKMTLKPKLKKSIKDAFAPIEDLWEKYQ